VVPHKAAPCDLSRQEADPLILQAAGDLCRRFTQEDVECLMSVFNETRLEVWREQPPEFFEDAFIEGSSRGDFRERMVGISNCR